MNPSTFGLLALAPLILGPLPAEEQVLVTSLCADGGTQTIEIPLGPSEPALPEPCEAKACHAASRSKNLIQRKDG